MNSAGDIITKHSAPTAQQTKAWSTADSADLYRIDAWSGGYFAIDNQGYVVATPRGNDGPTIRIKDVVDSLANESYSPPLLIRFADILSARLSELHNAFASAIEENNYQADYLAVYPIKVNQQRRVVEEVFNHGRDFGFGLEVGSKPELLAVLAMTMDEPERLIICNGFKDEPYIKAAVLGMKLGRNIIPVVEKFDELELILNAAATYNVRPRIGVRIKLASQGAGRWRDSAGSRSKFGLFINEALRLVDMLRKRDILDCLQLVHCHVGSQVNDMRMIKDAINELTHIYIGLKQLGAHVQYLDIGGGLGVDYDGNQTSSDSSMNYTVSEYASDIVYRIKSVCDRAQIDHPTIVSESGRAMVTYSSVLVMNVLGSACVTERINIVDQELNLDTLSLPPLADLNEALLNLDEHTLVESYHDAIEARDQLLHLFNSGFATLEQRSTGERLFLGICRRVHELASELDTRSEALEELHDLLSETYFCNFSLFQSLPDSWAIGQLFPIMPLHRLDQQPDVNAVLVDITCDSDGRVDQFISPEHEQKMLPVHSLQDHDDYLLGAFLVGAYQETLGDLHNLFGDTHCVHIRLENDGHWTIDDIVRGDRIRDVLGYVQFDCQRLQEMVAEDCDAAVADGRMTSDEAAKCKAFYADNLQSSTYLGS